MDVNVTYDPAKFKLVPIDDVSSHCSSRPTEGIERQDAANAMCEAIAAFNPVCDDIAKALAGRLRESHAITRSQYPDVRTELANVMQETLRRHMENDDSTPA